MTATFNSIVAGIPTNSVMYTVATLPSPSLSGAGTSDFVVDALLPTVLSTVTAGGSIVVRVFSNGTNWIVG